MEPQVNHKKPLQHGNLQKQVFGQRDVMKFSVSETHISMSKGRPRGKFNLDPTVKPWSLKS